MGHPSVGTSANFDYKYDDTLADAAVAKQRAQYFLSSLFCEQDLTTLESWFAVSGGFGATNRITALIARSGGLGSNGGYQTGGATTTQVAPFNGSAQGEPVTLSQAQCRAVLVAELSEVLMSYRNQTTGVTTWEAGHSQGEALSTVCEALLHPDGYYAPANLGPRINTWLTTTPLPNFIDNVDPTDKNFVSIGCGVMFLYFLMYECDLRIGQIITAGGLSLADKFQQLTGTAGAWNAFSGVVEKWYTIAKGNAPTSDDVLPHPGRGPGIAGYGTTLYLAWKGESGDNRLFYTNAPWKTSGSIPGNSSVCPSLAAFTPSGAGSRSRLYVGYKAEPGDKRIFVSFFDGTTWAPQQMLGANSSIGPSLAVFNNILYAVYKGEHADQRAFLVSTSNGNTWNTQQLISGLSSSTGPAITAFAPAKGGVTGAPQLFAAFKGAWSDEKIFVMSMSSSGVWSAPNQIPGIGTSSSVSLAVLANLLYVAYKDQATENIFVISTSDGVTWGSPTQIANVSSSVGPSLSAFSNTLYLACKGAGTTPNISLFSSSDGKQWVAQPHIPGNTSPNLAGSGSNQ